jgi:hypothetical protein
MAYHGISTYQFYTALKHVDEGTTPATVHGNELLEHSRVKQGVLSLAGPNLHGISQKIADQLQTGVIQKST